MAAFRGARSLLRFGAGVAEADGVVKAGEGLAAAAEAGVVENEDGDVVAVLVGCVAVAGASANAR